MKILIEKTIAHKCQQRRFTFQDILNCNPLPTDKIECGFDEGFVSENESWDSHNYLIIKRMVEETDEEERKRLEYNAIESKLRKQNRYESYLKLKKEFEGNENG